MAHTQFFLVVRKGLALVLGKLACMVVEDMVLDMVVVGMVLGSCCRPYDLPLNRRPALLRSLLYLRLRIRWL
jgi:hypothetical protein